MFKKIKILVAEKSSFSQAGLEKFSRIAATEAYDLSQTDLVSKIKAFNILLVRLGLRVDETVLAATRKLLVVGTPTTGLDHIDLVSAARRGVAVLSLQGERSFLDQVYATAEHTMALLLSLIRKLPSAFEAVKHDEWRRDIYRGHELNGKTLGIVGCGRLGSMVAHYAQAFNMNILVYDPYQSNIPEGITICSSLEELLVKSDIVSIHVILNEETKNMFSNPQFDQLKPGAFFVNSARGDLVDEVALLKALKSGRLAGAALDVVQNEDRIGKDLTSPLVEYARSHDNLIITPHIGGATFESVEKADLFIADKIHQYLKALPSLGQKL